MVMLNPRMMAETQQTTGRTPVRNPPDPRRPSGAPAGRAPKFKVGDRVRTDDGVGTVVMVEWNDQWGTYQVDVEIAGQAHGMREDGGITPTTEPLTPTPPVGAPPPPGAPVAPPPPGAPVAPVATPGPVPPPPELLENLGLEDVARRFAIGSGVAPDFRQFMQQMALNRRSQFGLQGAMGQLPGIPFTDIAANPELSFERFLTGGGVNRAPRQGQTLLDVASFLRAPSQGIPGGIGPEQEYAMDLLLGPEGSTGTQRFGPTIDYLIGGFGNRSIASDPSFGNPRGAISRALRNFLANSPNQFPDLPSFIDFLNQQKLIR